MNEKLEPCPFCGGEAILNHDYRPVPERWHWGECTVCGIQGKPEYEEYDAVLNWNKRTEKVCRWKPKDAHEFFYEHDYWETECSNGFILTADGLPAGDGFHYCPNCGGKVEVEE